MHSYAMFIGNKERVKHVTGRPCHPNKFLNKRRKANKRCPTSFVSGSFVATTTLTFSILSSALRVEVSFIK